jgi:ubiquinone/menaquinone biosynthesis C-methylase UbiE
MRCRRERLLRGSSDMNRTPASGVEEQGQRGALPPVGRGAAQEASVPEAWERFLANAKAEGRSSPAAWSETYRTGDHSVWDHESPSTELIGYILARLPPGARVLDLGCGTGADAIFLASQNFEAHGVDFSKEALRLAEQRAREQGVSVDWRECSALNTPFDDRYFDLITDRGCFHHIAGPCRRQYAGEIARILRPGGVLFLRGCRASDDGPFFPVDDNSILESFDPQLFEIGNDIPFFYAVDSGGIPATAVTIVRRGLNPPRGKRPLLFFKRPTMRGPMLSR